MVGNFHSEFGHARPSGSRVIRYVRDGQVDKSNNHCPFPTHGGITIIGRPRDEISLHAMERLVTLPSNIKPSDK